jgi:hypothetical protein
VTGARHVEETEQDRAALLRAGFGLCDLAYCIQVRSGLRDLADPFLVPAGICDLAYIASVNMLHSKQFGIALGGRGFKYKRSLGGLDEPLDCW